MLHSHDAFILHPRLGRDSVISHISVLVNGKSYYVVVDRGFCRVLCLEKPLQIPLHLLHSFSIPNCYCN